MPTSLATSHKTDSFQSSFLFVRHRLSRRLRKSGRSGKPTQSADKGIESFSPEKVTEFLKRQSGKKFDAALPLSSYADKAGERDTGCQVGRIPSSEVQVFRVPNMDSIHIIAAFFGRKRCNRVSSSTIPVSKAHLRTYYAATRFSILSKAKWVESRRR